MTERHEPKIIEEPRLRNRTRVFEDRRDAGRELAKMLAPYEGANALVLGIPSGGVPVAAIVAETLDLPLDAAVVSKITLPWNSEAGYGAVAFDGTVKLNETLVTAIGLSPSDIEAGIRLTQERVRRRDRAIRGDRDFPDVQGKSLIVVDDGIASGFTVRTAVEALRGHAPAEIVLATPTAHLESLSALLADVSAVYCPNIRSGHHFAVADAYRNWTDVDEDEAITLLMHAQAAT